MRRILLVLALTALLVTWVLAASSGFAQEGGTPRAGCEGLVTATAEQQEGEEIPTKAEGKTDPFQGDEHSAVQDVQEAHDCTPKT